MPGDSPWRIKSIIFCLFLFYLVARFYSSDEPVVVDTRIVQAEVVGSTATADTVRQSGGLTMVKVRLPDGMHAYIGWDTGLPRNGDAVDVIVKVQDDGSRRVTLRKF